MDGLVGVAAAAAAAERVILLLVSGVVLAPVAERTERPGLFRDRRRDPSGVPVFLAFSARSIFFSARVFLRPFMFRVGSRFKSCLGR